MCLIFAGKILKDEETLENQGVKDGLTIHMVIRSGGAKVRLDTSEWCYLIFISVQPSSSTGSSATTSSTTPTSQSQTTPTPAAAAPAAATGPGAGGEGGASLPGMNLFGNLGGGDLQAQMSQVQQVCH